MMYRVSMLVVAGLALAVFMASPVLAEKAAEDNTHEGTVVKAGDGKLTMTGKNGKEHTHEVPEDAKITCDGKECTLADLKEGTRIKVTMAAGKVVSIAGTTVKNEDKDK